MPNNQCFCGEIIKANQTHCYNCILALKYTSVPGSFYNAIVDEQNKYKQKQNEYISDFYPHTLADFDDIISEARSLWISQYLIPGAFNMSTAAVTHDPTIGTYDVVFKAGNFDDIRKAVAFIKTFVPAAQRSYNSLNKTWTIDESQWPICEAAFKSYFTVRVIEKSKPKFTPEDFFYNHAPTSNAPSKESIAQQLEVMLSINIATTSFDDLKRAYRRKALELHPDRNNGDGSKMSELNAAWTIYNK